uniref:Uncharacterized protein n=1 Tax=Rhizophora mucronata TaxID=61149 RepID=A0A2P2NHB0_RHIMU
MNSRKFKIVIFNKRLPRTTS